MEVNGRRMPCRLFLWNCLCEYFNLLTSGATITVAHLALIEIKNNRQWSFINNYTFSSNIYSIQVYEYKHAPFLYPMEFMVLFLYVNRSSWSSCYYGTIFILVQMIRVVKSIWNLKSSWIWSCAWYWHFVDVVWLLLFIIVYVYGSNTI